MPDATVMQSIMSEIFHIEAQIPRGTDNIQSSLDCLMVDKLLHSAVLSARSSAKLERMAYTLRTLARLQDRTNFYAGNIDEPLVDSNVISEVVRGFLNEIGQGKIKQEQIASCCASVVDRMKRLNDDKNSERKSVWFEDVRTLWIPHGKRWKDVAQIVPRLCEGTFHALPDARDPTMRNISSSPFMILRHIHAVMLKEKTFLYDSTALESFLSRTMRITKSKSDDDPGTYADQVLNAIKYLLDFGINPIVNTHRDWFFKSKGKALEFVNNHEPNELANYLARQPSQTNL